MGCTDYDLGYTADEIAYETNFQKKFGKIDPEHTWNTASQCKVNINVPSADNLGTKCKVQIYTCDPRSGQKAYLLADLDTKPGANLSFDLDYPAGQSALAFGLIAEDGGRVVRSAEIVDGRCDMSFISNSSATRAGGMSYRIPTAYNYTQITDWSTSKENENSSNNISFQIWRATDDNWTFTSHEDLMAYFSICPEAPSMVHPVHNTYADIAASGKTTSFMFASHGAEEDIVITPVFGCTSNTNTLGFYILDTEGTLVSDYVILSTNAKTEMEFSANNNDVIGNFIDNRLASSSSNWYGSWIIAGGDGTAADVVNEYKNNNMFLNTGGTTRSHSWVLRGIPADYRICFYLIKGKSTLTDSDKEVAYTEQTKNPWIDKDANGAGVSDKDYIACLDDAIKNNIYTYREDKAGFGYYDARASLVTVNDALAYIGFEDAWDGGKHWSSAQAYDINDIVIQISGVSTVDYSSSNIDEAEFLVACEDLGDLNDFDFNDVVFSVNPKIVTTDGGSSVSKTIKFGLKASGGTLPLYVYYTPAEDEDASVYYDGTGTTLDHKIGDGQTLKTVNIFAKSGAATSDTDPDTHAVFGVEITEPVNVNAVGGKTKPAVASNVVVRDASFTVTEPKQLSIVVDQTRGTQGNYGSSVGCMKNNVGRTDGVVEIPVTATTPGQVPKAFIVGDATWQWHDENVSMANDADFVAWAANHTDNRWYKYIKGSLNIKTITTIDDVTKDAYPTFTHIPASALSSYTSTGCVVKFTVSTSLSGLTKYPAVTLCHYPNDYKKLNIPVYIETTATPTGVVVEGEALYSYTLGDKRTYYVELSPEDVQAAISTTAGDGSTTVDGGIMLNGSLLAVDSYEVLSYDAAGAAKEATKISDFTTYAAVSFLPEPTNYPTSVVTTATIEADAFADYTYCGITGANIIVELQNMKSNSVLTMQVFDGDSWVTKKTCNMTEGEEYAVIHLSTRCIQEIFSERYTAGNNGVRFALSGGDHTSNIAHTYVTSEPIEGCSNPSDLTIVNTPITVGRGKSITIRKGVDFTTSSSAAITVSVGSDANNDIQSIVENGNGSWTITMNTNSEASTPTIKVTQAALVPTYGGGSKIITLNYDPAALDPATLTVTTEGIMSIKVGEMKALNECSTIPTYNKGANTTGAITFSTDDTDIIEVNETTGAVTAKATSTATVKINQASDGVHMAASLAYVTVTVSAPDLSAYGTVLSSTSTSGEVSASNYWINNEDSYYIDSRSFKSYASAIITVYIDEVFSAVKTYSVNGGPENMSWANEKNWAWLDSEGQPCSIPTKAGIYSFVISSSGITEINTSNIPGIKIEGAKILTIAVKGVEESPISVPESVTINTGDDVFSAYIDVNRNGASGTISVEQVTASDITYSIDGNRITFTATNSTAAGNYAFDVNISSDAQYAAGTKRVNVIVSTLRSPNLQFTSGVPVAQLTTKGQTAEIVYSTNSTGVVTVDQPANGCATVTVDQENHKIIVEAVKTGSATIYVHQEGVVDAFSADLKQFDIEVLISLTPFPMNIETPVTLSSTTQKDNWNAYFNKWIDLSAYSMPVGANYLKVQFSNTSSPGGFGYQIGSSESDCSNSYGSNSYIEISEASVISSIFDNGGILLGYYSDIDFGTVTMIVKNQ